MQQRGDTFDFEIHYSDDGSVSLVYLLSDNSRLQLALDRDILGYHVAALTRAFEVAFGEPTSAEIAGWETEIARTEEMTETEEETGP